MLRNVPFAGGHGPICRSKYAILRLGAGVARGCYRILAEEFRPRNDAAARAQFAAVTSSRGSVTLVMLALAPFTRQQYHF